MKKKMSTPISRMYWRINLARYIVLGFFWFNEFLELEKLNQTT